MLQGVGCDIKANNQVEETAQHKIEERQGRGEIKRLSRNWSCFGALGALDLPQRIDTTAD